MKLRGKINFIDYGSDDFSNFADGEYPHNNGNWFLVGLSIPEAADGILFACDAARIDHIMRDAECCRLSQLLGREISFDTTEKAVDVVK